MKFLRLMLLTVVLSPFSIRAEESVWDKGVPVLENPVEMTVYRSPTCGCCGKWLEHMKKHGFTVRDIKSNDMDRIKKELGVPENLQSCHTALVNGYVVEGHVPAADVQKLLQAKPEAAGLAVPGMPAGTPGMEMGGKKDPFAVLLFDKKGRVSTFQEYRFY
ncbi:MULTISPECIES: DUF411 domain-containing protein [Methylocaldum]|jgi:hypothetical protein|uniref:DUF411 domain-containing protein n=1 Tax=unclassified Methylocaldum TaxID=2622260 RepID=UPI000A326655|nr:MULTISPECIES: DUF411 domain-containing protein [unclassified Methylocaldum]MBP1151540.1 hypothetical protein [Methylocaldum sp. RMAD-M]MVF22700.1 DUF411 domain-containing protein [Methylocaldum sp. BRCS4]